MKLYHCTTEKKAKHYQESKSIHNPVRGFDTIGAAMLWCIKVGRTVIYEIECDTAYMLPDHHNKLGRAYWTDQKIYYKNIKCVVSKDNFKANAVVEVECE